MTDLKSFFVDIFGIWCLFEIHHTSVNIKNSENVDEQQYFC